MRLIHTDRADLLVYGDETTEGIWDIELAHPDTDAPLMLSGTARQIADQLRTLATIVDLEVGPPDAPPADRSIYTEGVAKRAADVLNQAFDAAYDNCDGLSNMVEILVQALSDARLLLTDAEYDILAALTRKTYWDHTDAKIGLSAAVTRWKAAGTVRVIDE
jgi:hypothetical protein